MTSYMYAIPTAIGTFLFIVAILALLAENGLLRRGDRRDRRRCERRERDVSVQD